MKPRLQTPGPRWVLFTATLAGCALPAHTPEPRSPIMTSSIPTQSPAPAASPLEQNEQIVRRVFEEGFNRGDVAVLGELVAADYIGPQGKRGPAAFGAVYATLHGAFPDLRYEIDEVAAEADRVAVRWHWTGTHLGPFRSFAASDAVVAATGKRVENTGAGFFRLRAGKIVQASLLTDQLGFLQAIGVAPDTATLFRQATPR
jgi:predicted ester cyclase